MVCLRCDLQSPGCAFQGCDSRHGVLGYGVLSECLACFAQGKGRSVDTNQHHVVMPGLFTQYYTKPKVSPETCLFSLTACGVIYCCQLCSPAR